MAAETLVIPANVALSIREGTLAIEYDGSVSLHDSMGQATLEIDAGGDIEIHFDDASGHLRAGNSLKVHGSFDGGLLHGREVVIGDATIRCTAISATERIVIGAAKLKVDVIIAPEIQIDPKASGRVTVIESSNDPGPTKIKGGFSLAEYDEIIGDAHSFLAERGVAPLGEPSPARARPVALVVAAAGPDEEDDIDDPLSLSDDDLEPLQEVELEPNAEDEELHTALADAVKRITSCYDSDLPPPVQELQELLDARDYEALRQGITGVWNGLLTYHQGRGIRPHHQVTHAFNVIHGLLQPA